MSLNLSTLTSPTSGDDILADIANPADSFQLVASLNNLATVDGAASDATQTVSVAQGIAVQSKGLYLPGTTSNSAAVTFPTINSNDDFVLEMEVDLANVNDLHLVSGGSGNERIIIFDTLTRLQCNMGATKEGVLTTSFTTGQSVVRVERVSGTVTLKQDGVTLCTITGVTGAANFTHISWNGQFNTSVNALNGVVKTVNLSINGTEELNIDFTSNNITTGATSFTADSGQVVTINQSGDDFAHISKGSHLIMDLVDDEYEFTTDAAIDGTIVVATKEGTYSAGISLDADTTYKLQARGVSDQSGPGLFKNIVGCVITTEPVDESAIQALENYFVSKGAGPRSMFGSVTNFHDTWRGCSTITTFPLIDTSNGNFYQTWRDCSSLVSFPLIDTTGASSINQTWLGCSSLSSFPLIDTSSITYFGYGWMNCTSLKSFPLIDTSLGTNFTNAWYLARNLSTFPAINTSSAENLGSTWRGCSNLSSFPLIDTSSVENFTAAWQDCTSLSSFPLIDGSAATSNNRTWFGCQSLSSFPAIDLPLSLDFFQSWSKLRAITSFPLIDVSSGKRFTLAWQQCTNLTTFPAGFFDNWSPPSVLNQAFNEAWGNCTSLTPQSVENILVSLAASGVHGTGTGASGGTQLADNEIDIDYNASLGAISSTALNAIATLNTNGWVVVINGVITAGVVSDPVPAVGTQSIFAFGSDWKYYDQNADPGAFTTVGYDDSSWSSGPGELGFGDGDEATTITRSSNNASYAFRKTVDITSGGQYDEYDVDILFDDGVVLYVNGEEQARSSNWSSGAISWGQFATSTISDTARLTPTIPASAFVDGENVLAVQVSNNQSGSSDVSFNMGLDAVKNAVPYNHIEGDFAVFTGVSAVANVADGPTSLDEISGITSLSGHTSNIGMFAVIDDNVNDRIFFIDRDGASQGAAILQSDTWNDGEAVTGYTDQTTGTRHLIIGGFGDNSGNTDIKKLIITEEPLVTGSDITINSADYEVVEFRYPSTPAFVDSPNNDDARGDAEAFFVCPIDQKIYIMSKREQFNRVYSLPLQSSYSGVQTMTFEGTMSQEVQPLTTADGTIPGGANPYSNAVDAAIDEDLKVVLVKNLDKVYQFYRTDTSIPWSTVLTVSAPIEETNYVGFGPGPGQEPQGEAITFDANNAGYYTVSEYSGSPGSLPLYYYPLSAAQAGVYSITQGKDGYTGGSDTFVWSKAGEEDTNFSSSPTIISDKNPSDERWGFNKFGDLDTLFADNSTVTVTDASFTFYVAVEGQGIAFHEALSAIDASTVTYTTVDGTMSPGIGYDAVAMAEDPLADNFVGEVTVNFPVSTVQNWIRNPEQNFGFWHLATHSSDGQQLSANEAPNELRRPTLNFTIS